MKTIIILPGTFDIHTLATATLQSADLVVIKREDNLFEVIKSHDTHIETFIKHNELNTIIAIMLNETEPGW